MGTKVETEFDEVTNGFELIPVGRYLAKLVKVAEEQSSTDNPMLVWDWELVEEYIGKEMTSRTTLLPHAMGAAKQHFQAFGSSWKKGDELDKLAKKFIGKRAILVIVADTFKSRKSGDDLESRKISAVYPAKAGSTSGTGAAAGKTGKKPGDDVPF